VTRTGQWPTPQWLVDQLAAEFGPFDLDPAATAGNAKAPAFFTAAEDGLARPWLGRVWLNPLYGRDIGTWMRKAGAETRHASTQIVIALVPASMDAAWFRQATSAAGLTRIWPSRIGSPSAPTAPPSASAILA
jgi:phage N-6-adenine-methyltransferase